MIDWNDVTTWQILLVDDEPDNLEVVAETLKFRGAYVKTASNGQVALYALKDFAPNLIIADLSMPIMDGWAFRAHLKNDAEYQQYREVPLLALSAHAMRGDKERALSAGFNGYLIKPVDVNTLTTDICNALNAKVEIHE